MFFNEGFTHLHLHWVERIDFGNLGDEVGAKVNGVIIGAMRGELVMGFLREDICEIFAPVRYGWFNRSCRLGNLSGDSRFIDLFSV